MGIKIVAAIALVLVLAAGFGPAWVMTRKDNGG